MLFRSDTSHKGETHDGRSFSSHGHSTQSLAQDHTDHSKKADQVVQVDDRGAGKEKGFVDSLPLEVSAFLCVSRFL